MFYVAVFLAGEWSEIDFTWPGKILCCVLCVMGIALFAIPVGTVFEAFQDVLQEVHGEDCDEDCDDEHRDEEDHTKNEEGLFGFVGGYGSHAGMSEA